MKGSEKPLSLILILNSTPHLPRVILVEELCDANVGKHCQPACHVVLLPLYASQQANAAQEALREAARHDLGDGVVEDTHAEEGEEDGPVELVEEGELWGALDHQAAIGEPDEDDAEEEVEEVGVDVDVGHHLVEFHDKYES